jgi:hypothetical protein
MSKSKIQREIDSAVDAIKKAESSTVIASYVDSDSKTKWAIKSNGTMKFNFDSEEEAFKARFD